MEEKPPQTKCLTSVFVLRGPGAFCGCQDFHPSERNHRGGGNQSRCLSQNDFGKNSSIFISTKLSYFQPPHSQKDCEKRNQFQKNPSTTKVLLEPGTHRKKKTWNRQTDRRTALITQTRRGREKPRHPFSRLFLCLNKHIPLLSRDRRKTWYAMK